MRSILREEGPFARAATAPVSAELVIFDCDGVIADSEVISALVLIEELAREGIATDIGYVRRHFLGRSFPTVARTIREGLAQPLPADFEMRYRNRLLARFQTELRPTQGVVGVIRRGECHSAPGPDDRGWGVRRPVGCGKSIDGPEAAKHGAATIGVRPEHIAVSTAAGTWKGTVGVSEHLGSDTFFHVHDTGLAEAITVRAGGEVDLHHGDTVWLTPEPDKIHRFDKQGLRIA